VVLPDADMDEARQVVERMRQLTPRGQTCSAGIAEYRPGDTAETLLARADKAMYAAKHGGRNQVALAAELTPPYRE